jgi:KTSC domain
MPLVHLHSTWLQAAVYDRQAAVLELAFRTGAVYRYFGVPAQIYQELRSAASQGGYFNHHIRNRFAYTQIHPATLA